MYFSSDKFNILVYSLYNQLVPTCIIYGVIPQHSTHKTHAEQTTKYLAHYHYTGIVHLIFHPMPLNTKLFQLAIYQQSL